MKASMRRDRFCRAAVSVVALLAVWTGSAHASTICASTSGDDGNTGPTWPTGAVGGGVTPVSARPITWGCGMDLPDASAAQCRDRVCADDAYAPPIPPGMVLIPAGSFLMGNTFPGEGHSFELPVHTVYVSPFYMDKCEVTNAQYAAALNWAYAQGGHITVTSGVVYKYNSGTSYPYCDTTSSSSYSRITWSGSTFGVVAGKENHPMVMVSWYGAAAYANWRSAMEGKPLCYNLSTWTCAFGAGGYRLPTEAEWEKAARGGVAGHRFPWSDSDDIQHTRANYYSSATYPYDTSSTRGFHPLWGVGSYPWTTPVGFFTGALQYKADWGWPGAATSYQTTNDANSYGLYDMAGNALEWCHDWYSATYYSTSPSSNPTGPASGANRVYRGASWANYADSCRVADRTVSVPGTRAYTLGFRLVLTADSRFDFEVRFPPPPPQEVILSAAASGPSPAQWRYTLSDPGADWTREDFDDSSWVTGAAGFGVGGSVEPLDVLVTPWSSYQIWLRRTFVLSDTSTPLVLWGRWDDAISVYINGVPAFTQNGWVGMYRYAPISDEALASLRSGVNTLAVTVINTGGPGYFDMGLAPNPVSNMPVSGYAINQALDAFSTTAIAFFQRNIIPAAAVAVMKGERIVLKRGYGYMDKHRTTPVPPDAVFRLASLDKTPGAASVRRLIDAGFIDPVTGVTLALNTPVFPLLEARGLQPLTGHTPDPRIDQITVQHIIDHRSGLSEMPGAAEMLAQTGVPLDQYSSNDNVRYVYSQPLAFTPGSDSRYCSSAYMVLRHLVDVLTGGFESYFANVVMDGYGSLGMAIVHEPLALRSPLEPWYETLEMPFERDIYLDHFFALTASAEAYARFCRGYNLGNGQHMIDPNTGNWAPVPDNGWTYFLGGMSGTRTEAIQRRWDEVTIVILTNSNTDVAPLGTQLFNIVDTLPPSAWKQTGDVDGDGHVDVLDLLYFVDAFGSQDGDASYNVACDFSGDGYVDVLDLLMLVENFGT